MQTEAIKAQEEAKQALEEELRSHQQLKLQLEQNKTLSDIVQKQLETLDVERARLQSDSSDIRERLLHYFFLLFGIKHFLLVVTLTHFLLLTVESCGRCQSGWLLFNTSCYFHATPASGPLKNWADSRADCVRRGGNLAVIDNLEEQVSPVSCG